MDEHDLSRFCCLNPDCADHGLRGHGNLTVTARYGPRRTRMLRCRTCKVRFSERKGTPLFDTRLPPDTVLDILAHVAEGVGTRKTARLVGVHRDTVTHYTRLAGDHAHQLHDQLVAFPPTTTEVQFDEKWDFVAKKEKNCDPSEQAAGDCWDHVALDPESRLVVSLVVGKRTAAATHALVADFRRRTGGRLPWLMTSDEYPVYADAIRTAYGQVVTPPRMGKPGRPRKPTVVMPAGLTYATVHKERANGRVVRVSTTLVFGTWFGLALALALSAVSRVVNAAFVERHNGTDRGRCSRKGRKRYEFSKDWDTHVAATRFSYFSYNFCWPVRTLRVKGVDGRWQSRTPAMAAKLTDHVWSIREWITLPAVQRR